MTILIEKMGEKQKAYNSLLISPGKFSSLGNGLSLKIIRELASQPGCAMDLARKLNQDEQKVYYHIRKLEKAGIIKMSGTERRYGMTAKIYTTVAPVVATKLYDEGHIISEEKSVKDLKDPNIMKFLHPFIENGKLNAKIIFGNPYPHGKYDQGGLDACYVADVALFLGNFIKELKLPCYKLDTHVREADLRENLIIIGGPKFNMISHKINSILPVYFDENNDWNLCSRATKKVYKGDSMGMVVKHTNPFNKNKKILLLAGKRTRGTVASVIAFTQYTNDVIKSVAKNGSLIKIVEGLDRSGDDFTDSVRFIE
jgi:DNA-binding transcriptional ArsR family regulator